MSRREIIELDQIPEPPEEMEEPVPKRQRTSQRKSLQSKEEVCYDYDDDDDDDDDDHDHDDQVMDR